MNFCLGCDGEKSGLGTCGAAANTSQEKYCIRRLDYQHTQQSSGAGLVLPRSQLLCQSDHIAWLIPTREIRQAKITAQLCQTQHVKLPPEYRWCRGTERDIYSRPEVHQNGNHRRLHCGPMHQSTGHNSCNKPGREVSRAVKMQSKRSFEDGIVHSIAASQASQRVTAITHLYCARGD